MVIEIRPEEIKIRGRWVDVENAVPSKFPQSEYWVSAIDGVGFRSVFTARWCGGVWCEVSNPDEEIDQTDDRITHWMEILKPKPPGTGNIINVGEVDNG